MSESQITNIENSEILIHTNQETLPLLSIGKDEYFGILKMKVAKTKLVNTPTFLLFTIDKTGSMNDKQIGSTTKMDYVVQTFLSMMNYLSTLQADIYIQVNTFNTDVDTLINKTKVTKDTIEDINNKIKSILPDGCTNIGKALLLADEQLIEYMEQNPNHQIAHIFMTDGDPTIGEVSEIALIDMVNEKYNNIIVGFGNQHNVGLLSNMGDKKNAEYQFVDNMENTSLVYGETIHKFIYPALRNLEIHIENGKLYNWQTNEWTDCLYEDIVISEIDKIYHLKTILPNNVDIQIYGTLASLPENIPTDDVKNEFKLLDTVISIPDLIDMETGEIHSSDLTKYAFRQQVQELLYYAKQPNCNRKLLKFQLSDAFRFLRKYMRTYELHNDALLKMLCDDLSITYKAITNNRGRAILLARHTSQGRQRTYNTGSTQQSDEIDDIIFRRDAFDNAAPRVPCTPRRLQRQYTRNISFPDLDLTTTNNVSLQLPGEDEINDDTFRNYEETGFFVPPRDAVFRNIFSDEDYGSDDEIDSYNVDATVTTCFATPGVLDTMKTMSFR